MLKTKDGYAKLIGTTYQGNSDYVLLSNGGSTPISGLRVNYASSAGDADTLDGEHASSFVRAGAIDTDKSDFNSLDTYSFIKSVWSTKADTSPEGIPGWYNVIQLVHRNGMSDGPNYIGQIALGMTVNMDDMFFRTKRYKDSQNPWNPWKTVIHSGNISSQTVASATKLVTARKIWGQSFDGTADINGTLYINNNNSENGAIILNNDKNSNARISAIDNEVIFNTGGAIRFGGTDWDYKKWAGLKYAQLTKTIYLGIADGSIFTTLGGAQSGGTLNLRAGISYIDLNSGTSIRGFGNSTHNSSINFTDTSISLSAYEAVFISSNVGIGTSNPTQKLDVLGNIRASGQIVREASNTTWNKGREGALLRETSSDGYHALWSLKTKDGSWDFGEYNYNDDWNNVPVLSYVTDDDFNNGPNRTTYQIKFPLASGTVALTSQISNADVNTAQYLRSLGTKNCQTGRTQDYGNVYSYSTGLDNTGAPTTYTSVMGFGRGIAGTVEIAGGWCNTGLYWRSLRDCCEDWYSWRTVLDDSNYTQFIDNYYWANVKISTTSSTTTSPTVHTLTATRICAGHNPEIDNSISCSNWFRSSGNTGWYNTTYSGGWYMSDTSWIRAHNDVGIYTGGQIYSSNSIRMSDIYLQNGNEINNSSSNLYLNYRTTSSISMCNGGGAVIIGPMVDNIGNNKLYVNGSAFINGSTSLNSTATFNGLVTNNGGILPANYDVNKNGTACYVWGDAMSTGVTAITDALDPRYVTVNYSRDDGRTWTNYILTNYEKFSLYTNNGSYVSIYLGNKSNEGNIAPVQVNQLLVTFEIPDSLYSALCWANVDIGNGVTTICTVEIIAKDGTIQNTFTKTMYGWNKFNYINFWGINDTTVDIGRNDARFVRFKFKHDTSNTAIRNAQIRKIRLFSFTKYNIDSSDFRSIMGNTGHLYKYDENLNVTFPNTIKATALQIAGNASFYDLYCNTLNHPSSTGTLIIGDKTQEVGIRSSHDTTLNALYLRAKLSSNVCFSANWGFCITPYYLSQFQNADTITISGNRYMLTNIGGDDKTISCIIADKCIIPPSQGTVRGRLIRFLPGNDGQIVLLKYLYTYGNGTAPTLYVQPMNCSIVPSNDSNAYIANGTISDAYNEGRSRFFIYSATHNVWIEFYCG